MCASCALSSKTPSEYMRAYMHICEHLRTCPGPDGIPGLGPDGIPFSAWRSLKGFGITVLFDVANTLKQDNCQNMMKDAYAGTGENGECDYNISTLVCLPKAATGG